MIDGIDGRRFPRGTGAYTLLELGIVLAILAVLAGATVPMILSAAGEEALWALVRNARAAALEARRAAIETGETQVVFIEETSIRVASWPEGIPGDDVRSEALVSEALDLQVWNERNRRWERGGVRWVFHPSGVCEPLHIRVRSSAGWIEQRFNPLTATAEEESWHFY